MLEKERQKLDMMIAENRDAQQRDLPPKHSNVALQKQRQKINDVQSALNTKIEWEAEQAQIAKERRPGPRTSTQQQWNQQKPAILGQEINPDMSYEQMKAVLRQKTLAELQAVSGGAGSVDPASGYITRQSAMPGSSRAMELSNRLQNFDSWFENMYRSEFGGQPSMIQPGSSVGTMTTAPRPPISSLPSPQSPSGSPVSSSNLGGSYRGLSRQDLFNIASKYGVPISSKELSSTINDLANYVLSEAEKRTGKPVAWM